MIFNAKNILRSKLKKAYLYTSVVAALLVSVDGYSQAEPSIVNVDVGFSNAEILNILELQGLISTGANSQWQFSATDVPYTLISVGDISFPLAVGTSEYKLVHDTHGTFKVANGVTRSVTRTTLDHVVVYSEVAGGGGKTYQKRPTLFVTIGGGSGDFNCEADISLDPWQDGLIDRKLNYLIDDMQYKHFAVSWCDGLPIQRQASDLAEAIEDFTAVQSYAWDVVLIGFSRGGVFAHQVSNKLKNANGVDNLHVALLDPTSSPTFGDYYPFSSVNGVFGSLKFDGLPFLTEGYLGTTSDQVIPGYSNYGEGDFTVDYANTSDPTSSHENFATNWLLSENQHGFDYLVEKVIATKNNTGQPFLASAIASGKEVLIIREEKISSDLDAECDDDKCTFQGLVNFGLQTVSVNGMVGVEGIDVAVSTAVAGATASLRKDQLTLTETTLFSNRSVRIDGEGITSNHSFVDGFTSVNQELSQNGVNVSVELGGYRVDLIELEPLDAIIPGYSHAKKKWKKWKKLKKKFF